MKTAYAYILLLLFSLFQACLSLNFSLYLKVSNPELSVEDIVPEEQQEESADIKVKELWSAATEPSSYIYFSHSPLSGHHRFSSVENIYFDVPHSPPDHLFPIAS